MMIDDCDPRGRHARHSRRIPGSLAGFGPGEHGRHRRARRGMVRDSVLVLLLDAPHNGYQIIVELGERTAGEWQPSPGAVYPCLSQLADEGLIASTQVDGQAAYALTDAGRQVAAGLPAEPWTQAPLGRRADEATTRALWDEFRQLARTLRLAADQATPAQLPLVTREVATLRRRIFALLSEPAEPEAPTPSDQPA